MPEGLDGYIRRALAGEAVEPPRLPSDATGLRRLRASLARRARVLDALRDAASGLAREGAAAPMTAPDIRGDAASGLAREGAEAGSGSPAPRLDRRA